MSRRRTQPAAAAALLLAVTAVPAQEADGNPFENPAPKLHRNPFERPDLARAAPPEVARPDPAPPPWTPVLKATMVAAEGPSLANVDGEMVREGEEYQGHRLVEVREREAVFERGGDRWVLSLD